MRRYEIRVERTETHETTVDVWAETEHEAKWRARVMADEMPGRWTKTNEEVVAMPTRIEG